MELDTSQPNTSYKLSVANTSYQKTRILLLATALFVIALGARLAFVALRGPTLTPDSHDYLLLARNLRQKGAFSLESGSPHTPTIRRAPLYPAVLAAFHSYDSASIGTVAVVIFQSAVDSLATIMILQLAWLAASLRTGVMVGLGYALHPGAIYFSSTILSEPLFTALSVAGVLALVHAFRYRALKWTAVAGVLLGLATLCRPIALPLAFLFAGFAAMIFRIPRSWLHALILAGSTTLTILPWTIRTTCVSEHLVLVQGGSSIIFYVATRTDWNQKDQATLWARFSTEDPYGRRLVGARTPKEMAEADQFGTQLALQNIRSNPKAYVLSRARNFPFLFITSFDMFTGTHKSFRAVLDDGEWLKLLVKGLLLLAFSLAPLLLGLAGLLGDWRNPAVSLPAIVWVYTALANLPMWIEYRYWVSAVPFLMVSAAVGLDLLVGKFRKLTTPIAPANCWVVR